KRRAKFRGNRPRGTRAVPEAATDQLPSPRRGAVGVPAAAGPTRRGPAAAGTPTAPAGGGEQRPDLRSRSVAGADRLQPLLAVHGRGAAGAGGGDGLAIVSVDHVAGGEDP